MKTTTFQRTTLCTAILAAIGSLAGFSAAAQDKDADTTVQRVEITGSSIKRVDAETALPVQTVTREQIAKMGVANAEELLSKITAVSQAGGTTTAQGSGVETYGLASVSLRGLGSARTLILVDGRRLANYATDGTSVDINSIPLAAVERVEVLKDGASGVYGSDAIAGVVNFILRKNFKGVELSASYGLPTTKGGGKQSKASIAFGAGDLGSDGFNLMTSLDFSKDSAIYGYQRKYASSGWDNGGRFDNSATPSGTLSTYAPGPTPHDPLASLGSGLGNPLAPDHCAANGSAYDANFPTCRFNSTPFVPLLPDVTHVNGQANLHARINENSEFFMEGFISHTKTSVTEQYSPISNSFLSTDTAFQKLGINPAIVLNPTNPAYPLAYLQSVDAAKAVAKNDDGTPVVWTPVAGKAVTVSYRAVDGGPRIHEDDSTLYHLTTGVQGSFGGFDYDAAYSRNESTVSESTQSGYQLQTALVKLLSGNDAFNPFALHQTPELAAQIAATNYDGNMLKSSLTTDAIDAKVSRDLYALAGGELTAVVGVNFHKEKIDITPSAAYETGDVAGYGGSVLPLSKSRDSHSFFAEVDAPLLKSLDADFSVRNDHYPDASSTNPKFSLKFTPTHEVSFRGSVGTGFREASLPELYTPRVLATSPTFKDPVTGNTGQFNILLGGTPTLVPEKSRQFSLGMVVEPVKNLSATVDYFNIDVKHLITTLSAQDVVERASQGDPAYISKVTRDANHNITSIDTTNLNTGNERTSGVDVDVNWHSIKTAAGVFGVDMNGTWVQKFDVTRPDGTVEHSVGRTINDKGQPLTVNSAGGIIFKWRHALTGSWTYGPFALDLTQNYQSAYKDAQRADAPENAPSPQSVGSFQTYDLQGGYTGIKGVTMRLGVKNLTNRQPPSTIGVGEYFQVGYDPSYYDPHGRFVYGSMTYKF